MTIIESICVNTKSNKNLKNLSNDQHTQSIEKGVTANARCTCDQKKNHSCLLVVTAREINILMLLCFSSERMGADDPFARVARIHRIKRA